ncbi:protein SpAN-like [Spodoptera litura]|uniref:Protein SpAN-like n=1 Tax=Spodoptera litura TaxID=69820 RepID=A0A9J7E1Q6_SPOLT|nr:protein SpAN-like [Spodoptera litura]
MSLQSLLKCSVSLFFIIFLIRPTGIQTLASIGKQQQYYHAVRKSGGAEFQQPISKSDLARRIYLHGDDQIRYSINDEPGFDLTKEEIDKFKVWPDGIIPYYIDVVSFSDKILRDQIRTLLNWLNSKTALSFQELPVPPEDGNTRWVFFSNRRGQMGCSDHSIRNFTNKGVQLVHVGYDCLRADLSEALLSLVGIPAQHTAPDRDEYIKVIEENILPEKRYLFKKLNNNEWLFDDVDYDYRSASHFDTHRYSMNGRATIVVRDMDDDNIGGQSKMTKSDLEKIRMLYNYIVKKTSQKIPDCNKLFKKSPKYFKRLDRLNEPEPRKKSNKYLGIATPDEPDEDYAETSGSLDSAIQPLTSLDVKKNKNKRRKNITKNMKGLFLESDYRSHEN